MLDYVVRAWSVFLIGFAPMAEIYIAVPAGLALGLDVVSAVLWSVAGNFAPILLLHLAYDQLVRLPQLRAWLGQLVTDRMQAQVEAGGFWFFLLFTPVLGTWAMGVAVKLLRVPPQRFLLPCFVSITVTGALFGLLGALGIGWLSGSG